jgi:hypothetical protein
MEVVGTNELGESKENFCRSVAIAVLKATDAICCPRHCRTARSIRRRKVHTDPTCATYAQRRRERTRRPAWVLLSPTDLRTKFRELIVRVCERAGTRVEAERIGPELRVRVEVHFGYQNQSLHCIQMHLHGYRCTLREREREYVF